MYLSSQFVIEEADTNIVSDVMHLYFSGGTIDRVIRLYIDIQATLRVITDINSNPKHAKTPLRVSYVTRSE